MIAADGDANKQIDNKDKDDVWFLSGDKPDIRMAILIWIAR